MKKFPVQLRTKVSEEDAQTITRNAEAADISVCAYLRECATRREVRSTVDVRMLAELRRIGGLVKLLHQGGQHEHAAAIRAGLAGIKTAIEQAEASRDR